VVFDMAYSAAHDHQVPCIADFGGRATSATNLFGCKVTYMPELLHVAVAERGKVQKQYTEERCNIEHTTRPVRG
jgi:hypothetical protein